ncbi:MAG: hypothetical protein KF866_07520 [Phycisphaeraceae bacterium]|nr:hypothetical protein [Phycisphaeraceae bacterium]
MTTQELIEMAVLDAVGLLDEGERKAFDAALAVAPRELQAHVRREQLRLSDLDLLLPDVRPPAGLRTAVIEAVREAIARELIESAGRAERSILRLEPSKRVSPMWRATAIGSMAAAIVLGISTFKMSDQYRQVQQDMNKNALLDQITAAYGASFVEKTLFDARTHRVVFAPESESFRGQASIWSNPDWAAARLFCLNLTEQEGEEFKLAVIDSEGRVVRELLTFSPRGGLDTLEVPSGQIDSLGSARLAVFSTQRGEAAVLSAKPLEM